MTNEQAIRSILEDWATSVRRQDIDGVKAAHADDVLMFDVVGPLSMRGPDKYRASWVDLFFPWHGGTGKFELKNLELTAGASVGFATALIDCAGTEAGRPVAFTVRLTVCLKKRDGAWLRIRITRNPCHSIETLSDEPHNDWSLPANNRETRS
jgi:ketosteroid isomerase-like protein